MASIEVCWISSLWQEYSLLSGEGTFPYSSSFLVLSAGNNAFIKAEETAGKITGGAGEGHRTLFVDAYTSPSTNIERTAKPLL
jgi:hypothetical protein